MSLPLRPLALAALVATAAGCRTSRPAAETPPDLGSGGMACTMEFRTYGVTLVDAAGRLVPGAAVDVRRSDGSTLRCATDDERGCLRPDAAIPSADPPEVPGPYHVIMTDGVRVAPAGETFTVNARAPGGEAVAATYRFRFDGCHVRKVAGADTLRFGR